MTRYVMIGGSFEYDHDWYISRSSLFNAMMTANGFELGPAFKWNGGISRWDFEAAGDAFRCVCRDVPYDDRNVVAYSNGGQVAFCAAAKGYALRTLTTVGTPYRSDVPVETAEDAIAYHQHIYDDLDPVRWLGEWDFRVVDRRFRQARNYNLRDIGHGGVFFDRRYLPFWRDMGWLEAIAYQATVREREGI